MERNEALKLLGLPDDFDSETLEEQWTQKCFPIREYFLRNPPIEALYRKRVQELYRFQSAYQQLAGQEPEEAGFSSIPIPASVSEVSNLFSLEASGNLLDLLRSYETALTTSRLAIAQSFEVPVIRQEAENMVRFEKGLHYILVEVFRDVLAVFEKGDDSGWFDEEIKISNPVDSGQFILALKKLRLDKITLYGSRGLSQHFRSLKTSLQDGEEHPERAQIYLLLSEVNRARKALQLS